MCNQCDGTGWINCSHCFGDGYLCTYCFGMGKVRCSACTLSEPNLNKKGWLKKAGNVSDTPNLRKPLSEGERFRETWTKAAQFQFSKKNQGISPGEKKHVIRCKFCGHQNSLSRQLNPLPLSSMCSHQSRVSKNLAF
jgi:hypothetical protein